MLVWVRKRLPIWCGCAAVDLNCHCDLSNVKLWHKFKWSCLIHLVYEQLCSKSVTCHVATSFVIRSIHLQVSLARSSKAQRLFVRPYFRERKKKKCWISKHSKARQHVEVASLRRPTKLGSATILSGPCVQDVVMNWIKQRIQIPRVMCLNTLSLLITATLSQSRQIKD